MSNTKKPADELAKAGKDAPVTLSESELDDAVGGISSYKDSSFTNSDGKSGFKVEIDGVSTSVKKI